MKPVFLIFCIAILSSGCRKDTDPDQRECHVQNYGTYRVNYTSTTLAHHILIGVGFGTREKSSAAGVLTDTIHLAPGTYSVSISSNNGGGAIDNDVSSATIVQCNETVKSVSF